MDNLSSHKVTGIREAIEAPASSSDCAVDCCGHKVTGIREAIEAVGTELRYLPPYSPDLNPIELAFSKLKKLLRDGAERTVDKLWKLCTNPRRILRDGMPSQFMHCCYRYT